MPFIRISTSRPKNIPPSFPFSIVVANKPQLRGDSATAARSGTLVSFSLRRCGQIEQKACPSHTTALRALSGDGVMSGRN